MFTVLSVVCVWEVGLFVGGWYSQKISEEEMTVFT
jgi:hypothetical protein